MVKNYKLDALIMLSGDVLIKKNVSLYKNTDTSTIERPRSLDRRVQRNINKEKRKQEFGTFYKYGRRFVAALLIVCTLSFAAVMSVDAAREAFWNAIVEFFDDYLSVSYVTKTEPPETIEDVKNIEISGYDWEKQVVLESPLIYSVDYYENEKIILSYTQNVLDENKTLIDNENSEVEKVSVGEYPAALIFRADKQVYSLCWSDGEYEYGLDAYSPEISKEDLIAIAETVK